MRITLWLLLASIGISMSAQAEVYKWTDASGRVVYSDQPPPAGTNKAKTVDVKNTNVTSVAANKKAAPAASASDASKPAAASAVAAAAPPRDDAACAAAQKRLTFLLNAKIYKVINDKGEVEFLEANKKKQEIAEKQDYLEKNCK